MNEQRKIERSVYKEVDRKLGVILRQHMEGKPILREMADRILSRERDTAESNLRKIRDSTLA